MMTLYYCSCSDRVCCDLAAVVRVLIDIEAKMMDYGSLVLRVFCANGVGIGFGVGFVII